MFLVLEGIDGAGKGRQRQEITEHLKNKVSELQSVEFPDHQGVLYKNLLKPALLEKISLPRQAWFLTFALDQVLYQQKIKRTLQSRDKYFICDGYFTTNLVYNSLVNKLISLDTALQFAADFEIAKADLNVFIDVKPETALQRKLKEEGHEEGLDINERDLRKQHQIRDAYLKMAKESIFGPWQIVDGNGSISEVTAQIISVLNNKKFIK